MSTRAEPDPVLDLEVRRATRARRAERVPRVVAAPIVFEVDHLAGRDNIGGLTVPLERDAHRDATELRSVMGQDDWPRPEGNPLLTVGHAIAGAASLLWLLARWLIRLGTWLAERFGAGWHEGGPASPLKP